MEGLNKMKTICGFYVSSIHLITMILPYIRKEINENNEIETILEYNLKGNVENILNKLIINDEEKETVLNINWKSQKIQKYYNMEKKLKHLLDDNNKINILISGSRKYIEEMNLILNKFLKKYNNKLNDKEMSIINLYEVTEFDNNIREILDKHELIINTSGIHKIEDIFEDYKKKKKKKKNESI